MDVPGPGSGFLPPDLKEGVAVSGSKEIFIPFTTPVLDTYAWIHLGAGGVDKGGGGDRSEIAQHSR